MLGFIPLFLAFLLTGLPRSEFRERGVRWWSWFRGWRELFVDANTVVAYRRGDAPGNGYACRLILGADQKLESVRAGQGTLWVRGIRPDPDGLRYRPGPKREWLLRPYEEIRRIDVRQGRFRIEAGDDADPAVIEGDAYQPNFLAGRIALEELLG